MNRSSDETAGGGVQRDRRGFLAVLGLAAAGGLAGCGGVTEQSFAAQQVGLSADAQEELGLAEVTSESQSVERQGPTGSVTVSITNHSALYSRAGGLGGE
jgi:hypothetical protein